MNSIIYRCEEFREMKGRRVALSESLSGLRLRAWQPLFRWGFLISVNSAISIKGKQ